MRIVGPVPTFKAEPLCVNDDRNVTQGQSTAAQALLFTSGMTGRTR
jgi:hypothetical protein